MSTSALPTHAALARQRYDATLSTIVADLRTAADRLEKWYPTPNADQGAAVEGLLVPEAASMLTRVHAILPNLALPLLMRYAAEHDTALALERTDAPADRPALGSEMSAVDPEPPAGSTGTTGAISWTRRQDGWQPRETKIRKPWAWVASTNHEFVLTGWGAR